MQSDLYSAAFFVSLLIRVHTGANYVNLKKDGYLCVLHLGGCFGVLRVTEHN